MVINVGFSNTSHEFDYWYDLLLDYNIKAMRWLNNILPEKIGTNL